MVCGGSRLRLERFVVMPCSGNWWGNVTDEAGREGAVEACSFVVTEGESTRGFSSATDEVIAHL